MTSLLLPGAGFALSPPGGTCNAPVQMFRGADSGGAALCAAERAASPWIQSKITILLQQTGTAADFSPLVGPRNERVRLQCCGGWSAPPPSFSAHPHFFTFKCQLALEHLFVTSPWHPDAFKWTSTVFHHFTQLLCILPQTNKQTNSLSGSERLVEKHACIRRFGQNAFGHKPLVCQDALAFLSAAKRVGSGATRWLHPPSCHCELLAWGRSIYIHAGGKVSHDWSYRRQDGLI